MKRKSRFTPPTALERFELPLTLSERVVLPLHYKAKKWSIRNSNPRNQWGLPEDMYCFHNQSCWVHLGLLTLIRPRASMTNSGFLWRFCYLLPQILLHSFAFYNKGDRTRTCIWLFRRQFPESNSGTPLKKQVIVSYTLSLSDLGIIWISYESFGPR